MWQEVVTRILFPWVLLSAESSGATVLQTGWLSSIAFALRMWLTLNPQVCVGGGGVKPQKVTQEVP